MPELHTHDATDVLYLGADENRMHPDWVAAVNDLLDEVENRPDPRPLVTIGEGRFFSNGLDLEWLSGNLDQLAPYTASVERLLCRFLTLGVPTFAAINGHAFGAGAMLALAHDFRLMREGRGYVCFPEVDIPLPFSPTMAALIQARLTPQAAVRSMTTGTRFAAEEAREIALVDHVVAASELLPEAVRRASALRGKDRDNLAAIKQTMFASVLDALDEGAR